MQNKKAPISLTIDVDIKDRLISERINISGVCNAHLKKIVRSIDKMKEDK